MITWFSRNNKEPSVSTKNDGKDFISLASHQLRSPLSVIKWYTEILLDGDAGELTDEQRKYLTVIESSNQRAIDLIRSLLNVSRLDLGTFSISPEDLSIGGIVTDVKNVIAQDALRKNVQIHYEEGAGVFNISADKHICTLVVKHLIGNAVAFSQDESFVKVTTSLVAKHSKVGEITIDDESVLLAIKDTGLGIPEKDKSNIFTKMFRGSNVKDTEGSDSGLGLYVTKTIVDIFGGKIWFDSEEGKGTTFYVAFPTQGMKKKEGTTVLE